jgi:3-deoxy-D-manno-octulosonic-acid transferase
LVDTVGELASLYASVDVAFVGGSLVPVGGHNLLEPAALGVPVITGPYQSNAQEIADWLLGEGAALQVADAAGLAAALEDLLTHPELRRRIGAKGLHVVAVNRGSLDRLLEIIEPLLA